MSACPHLTEPCKSIYQRERASCPGVPKDEFLSLVSQYPWEAYQNPLLPLLTLEDPRYINVAQDLSYLSRRALWISSLTALDGNKLRRLALEACHHAWWVRKGCRNTDPLALFNSLSSYLAVPTCTVRRDAMLLDRKEVQNQLRGTASSHKKEVLRALYQVSSGNAIEYRGALELLSDAVWKMTKATTKNNFQAAAQAGIAEVEWQQKRWAEICPEWKS